jgi:hypothetical protein
MAGLKSDFSHSMQRRKNLGNDEARMLGCVKAPRREKAALGSKECGIAGAGRSTCLLVICLPWQAIAPRLGPHQRGWTVK